MPRGEYLGQFEELVLLIVGRLGDEAYGMRVRREIEASTGRGVSIGAVYATLDRLADKAFVRLGESPGTPGERDGRARRFFRLTRAGSAALERVERDRAAARVGFRTTRARRS